MLDQKKKTLVLDLDSTLVDSRFCYEPNCDHEIICSGGIYSSGTMLCVHLRPKTHEFLQWCYDQGYQLIIFSAASEEYVNKVTELLFRDFDFKPTAVLTCNHLIHMEFNSNAIYYTKTLQTVSNLTGIQKESLLAIDDSDHNYQGESENVILIKAWDITQPMDRELESIRETIVSH